MRRPCLLLVTLTLVWVSNIRCQKKVDKSELFRHRIEAMEDISSDQRFQYFRKLVFPYGEILCGRFVGGVFGSRIGWSVIRVGGVPIVYSDEIYPGEYKPYHSLGMERPCRIQVKYHEGRPMVTVIFQSEKGYYAQMLSREVLDYGIYRLRVCTQGWLWKDSKEVNDLGKLEENCR
jgi:hypothetical protein